MAKNKFRITENDFLLANRKASRVALRARALTAVNQQKFYFELQPDEVTVKASTKWSLNSYAKVDLGIAKYHFKIGHEEAERFANTKFEFRWG